jgi:hypothetical protein
MAIVRIPKKNGIFAFKNPISVTAEKSSSIKEICMRTPAEKPIIMERCLCLKSLMKNATRLPNPVDSPATNENRKAITIVSIIKAPCA